VFYENWKNMKSVDRHLEMPYIKACMERMKKSLARPVQITLWVMVSPRENKGGK
jgi:quinol monooxygenase YgiN